MATNRINIDGQTRMAPLADTGVANAYVVSQSLTGTVYFVGMPIIFQAANANTGASTLDVNGAGPQAIVKSGSTPLSGGEINAGQIVLVVYDGTNFEIIGGSGGGSGDVVGPASAVDSDFVQFDGITGKLIKDGGLSLDTDGTLSADSDSKIASQKATKSYADTKVAGAASSTDSDFMQFSGTSGKAAKDGGLSLTTDGTLASNSDSLIPSEKAVKTYVDAHAGSGNVTDGGIANHGVTIGDATSHEIKSIATGTSGQFLKSAGSSADPAFANIAESDVTNLTTDLAAKAPLASPALTGTPTAPTAAGGTNTTQIATTAFVQAALPTTVNFVTGEVVSFSGTSGTLANTPTSGSVALYKNGSRLQSGSGNDYTISSATITLASAAVSGDIFLADYRH